MRSDERCALCGRRGTLLRVWARRRFVMVHRTCAGRLPQGEVVPELLVGVDR